MGFRAPARSGYSISSAPGSRGWKGGVERGVILLVQLEIERRTVLIEMRR